MSSTARLSSRTSSGLGRMLINNFAYSVIVFIVLMLLGAANGVPCFCTESRCTYGYCESAWCLVGIKHNGRVIRTCGGQTAQQLQPCRQDVGDWQDVCSCTTPYCNTFAYLRYEIRWVGQNVGPAQLDHDGHSGHRSSDLRALNDESDEYGGGGRRHSRKKVNGDKDEVVFERNEEKEAGLIRQSHLVVVLIVVPLAVAGTAVVVVVVGYYCKMC